MTAKIVPPHRDRIDRGAARPLTVTFDGRALSGEEGQTIAGVLLANGILAWRTTSVDQRPRGLFCGIGVCYDCIVDINDDRDIRACQRRAHDGDIIRSQHDSLPEVKR